MKFIITHIITALLLSFASLTLGVDIGLDTQDIDPSVSVSVLGDDNSLGDGFTIQCALLTVQRSDPIFAPGTPGIHVHAVVGGTAFNRTMKPEEARLARGTTCNVAMDKSDYWQPQLYHHMPNGYFELIPMIGSVSPCWCLSAKRRCVQTLTTLPGHPLSQSSL